MCSFYRFDLCLEFLDSSYSGCIFRIQFSSVYCYLCYLPFLVSPHSGQSLGCVSVSEHRTPVCSAAPSSNICCVHQLHLGVGAIRVISVLFGTCAFNSFFWCSCVRVFLNLTNCLQSCCSVCIFFPHLCCC